MSTTLGFGSNLANAKPLSLTFVGATDNDMRDALESPSVSLGRAKSATVTIIWPSSVDPAKPTGAFAVQCTSVCDASGNPDWTGAVAITECSDAIVVAGQPNGTGGAGRLRLRNLPMTDAYLRIIYTPTSGGAGVVPTATVYLRT